MFLVNCGDPGAPVNGNRSFTDTLEGSIVTYTCNAGFELVGNRTQTCELTPDGASWSYDRPECTCTVIVISITKIFIQNCYSYSLWRPWYTRQWRNDSTN